MGPAEAVAVLQFQQGDRAQPQWYVAALDKGDGKPRFRDEFHTEPLPGGLLIDRDGRVAVMMLNGSVICYGG